MLYELTLQGTYQGQQVINRWTYDQTGTPAAVSGAFALADAFGLIGEVVPPTFPSTTPFGRMLDVLHTSMVFNTGFVRALYSATDFYERPFPGGVPGEVTGEATSPIYAYGFRTNRVRLDVARGTKRLAGVSEEWTASGGAIAAGVIANINDVAAQFSAVLTYDDEGSPITFTPCVLGKDAYTTPRGNTAYRIFPTLAEQLEHTAIGVTWQAYTQVRSQVSRQYGRGG